MFHSIWQVLQGPLFLSNPKSDIQLGSIFYINISAPSPIFFAHTKSSYSKLATMPTPNPPDYLLVPTPWKLDATTNLHLIPDINTGFCHGYSYFHLQVIGTAETINGSPIYTLHDGKHCVKAEFDSEVRLDPGDVLRICGYQLYVTFPIRTYRLKISTHITAIEGHPFGRLTHPTKHISTAARYRSPPKASHLSTSYLTNSRTRTNFSSALVLWQFECPWMGSVTG